MSLLDVSFPVMGARGRIVLADRAAGAEPSERLEHAAAQARARLEDLQRRWTRFAPDSDLNLLTADPRTEIPAHADVRALVRAGAWAGRVSGGLVDMTLGAQIAQAGYDGHWTGETARLSEALAGAPPRTAATPHPAARWQALGADRRAGTIRRPAGVVLDSGGLGKGLAADLVAAHLVGLRFVVDVGGVATSGIHRRLWWDADGAPAHHLLDPTTGRPAWTGLLAVTAVGRSAVEAEVLAKTALLRGRRGARAVLAARGGVIVGEDGAVEVVPALRAAALRTVRERELAA